MPDTAHALARLAQQKAIKARRRRVQRQVKQEQVQTRTTHNPGGKLAAPVLAPALPSPQSAPQSPAQSPTQRQGSRAETRALAYLQQAGLVLLARNLSCRAGEIDLVCRDGDTLVFVEVRERHDARFGGAAASIHAAKQQRLIHAAQYWLPELCRCHFQGRRPVCRFDAVVLEGRDGQDDDTRQLQWIRHAFTLPA